MKALTLRSPQRLELVDAPNPALEEGMVIVRVHKCGICGSDIRYYYGQNPWAKQTLGEERPNPPNIILGHEFVGTVVEAASERHKLYVGKRVGINTWSACGRCFYCRNAQENLCPYTRHLGHGQGWGEREFYPGGMAEYCLAFGDLLCELPAEVTDDQATFFDPMTAALHAVHVSAPRCLDTVLIQGAGPIGLLIAQMVRLHGAKTVLITDIAAKNIEVALQLGVDLALDVRRASPDALREAVMERTEGRGVEMSFNTVGSRESIAEALRLTRKGGRVTLLAVKDEALRISAAEIGGEKAVMTSANAHFTDFYQAVDMVASGLVKVDPLITHRFALRDGIEAFRVACDKENTGAIKIVLDCREV